MKTSQDIRELLEHKMLMMRESMFRGTANVRKDGDVKQNIAGEEARLKKMGHSIVKSESSADGLTHHITSTKGDVVYHHTLVPHESGKMTIISTKIERK